MNKLQAYLNANNLKLSEILIPYIYSNKVRAEDYSALYYRLDRLKRMNEQQFESFEDDIYFKAFILNFINH